jgi:hypothetical protein
LTYAYREILGYAYEADLYVLGYPHVAPEKTASDPMDPRCPFLYYSGYDTMGRPVLWEDAQAARDIVDRLNAAIEDAVNEVREDDPENVRIHFVSATEPGSPFEGREMCSTGDSYFLNLDQWPGNNMAPFHPNEQGQAAYAELLADALTP